jgi:arylsulfatase
VAQRAPQQGATAADFVNETWELYHSEEDRAERNNLADQYPEKVQELVNLWYVEAGKHDVLPLDNRSMEDLIKLMQVADIPEGGIYRYYPRHRRCRSSPRRRSGGGRSRSSPTSS